MYFVFWENVVVVFDEKSIIFYWNLWKLDLVVVFSV